MTPLRVVAHLTSAPEIQGMLALDALLLWALGAEAGAAREDGWADPEEVIREAEAGAMPLARVEGRGGWWWACSHAVPAGAEDRVRVHRRPPVQAYERWCPDMRSVGTTAGPDKALRIPHFARWQMREIAWTCWGDADRIRALLSRVHAVGRRANQGCGMVGHWEVLPDPGGPPLRAYASDARIRALPVEAVETFPARMQRTLLPLRAPYYRAEQRVPVVQALPAARLGP